MDFVGNPRLSYRSTFQSQQDFGKGSKTFLLEQDLSKMLNIKIKQDLSKMLNIIGGCAKNKTKKRTKENSLYKFIMSVNLLK